MSITAGPGGVRVVVYDSRLDAFTLPGGDVYRYTQEKTRRAAVYAQMFAPVRSGALKASIRTDVRGLTSSTVGRIRATARHAQWVHEGTDDIIYPEGEFLWVPVAKYATKRRKRDFVRGQRANPFLERALGAAMRDPFSRGARLTGNPFG